MIDLRADRPEVYGLGLLVGLTGEAGGPGAVGWPGSVGAERATEITTSVFLLSMAMVVFWLTLRIGKGLKHRKVFFVMGFLFAACGAARLEMAFGMAGSWPGWLLAGMKFFMPGALLMLSVFVFSSVPPLMKVLRASDEIQSLRGQAKLKALVQAAPMAVVGADCEGRITFWNPAAEKIFGWKEQEILGTRGLTLPEEEKGQQFALLERTLQGEVTKAFEATRVARDGKRFPVSISVAPLHDDEKTLMGVMATIEDISERKRIERELSEKTETLTAVTDALNNFLESGDWAAASRRLLAHTLKQTQSPMGFLGAVVDGHTLRVLAHEGITWDMLESRQLYEAKMSQQAALGYFELSHHGNLFGEILSKSKTVVSNMPESDPRSGGLPAGHPRLGSFLGVPILKGSTVVGLIAVANRAGGYTGEESRSLETLSQAAGMLYDNYGQSLKRTQLEGQEARLQGEVRRAQKMEVLGQLSGGIAHDFNNLLMILSGSAELLEDTLTPQSASMRYVEQIRRTIDKAEGITKQLLAFSRKQVLEIGPVDLHQVLTDSEFILPRLLGPDIQLTFQHQAAHPWIKGDAAQMEQVIANLAINAREAMPGGGTLTISTRNAFSLPEAVEIRQEPGETSGWVVLEVKDTGCGMDTETRTHMFEPFFTTKPEGTGMGLSTVYGIVSQFGGQIHLESQKGEGARFQLYFPAQDSTVPQAQAPPRRVPGPREQANRLTILLADDEPALRASIAEYLRGKGHEVLESESAFGALETARSHAGCIDVLLTDVLMPGLRGPELAQRVQELRPDVHVIYVSGYAQSFPEARVPPGAAFLQKPFRLASLGEELTLVPRKV